jgi:hypothetical protein
MRCLTAQDSETYLAHWKMKLRADKYTCAAINLSYLDMWTVADKQLTTGKTI